MKMRWTTAAMVLPVLAVLSGCGPDAAQPVAPADAPVLDVLPGSAGASGGYYGSGHDGDDTEPPPVQEDTTWVPDS